MEFIAAKTILTKVKNGNEWYGIDYNMNLYKGCSHGCIYCDSRSNCYHIDNFDIVRGKENALCILEQELYKKRQKGVIGIGAMSDTYNPLQKKDEHFIGFKEKYIQYYGNRYNCIVPNYKKLYNVFVDECTRYGILYDMQDIINAYKKDVRNNKQLTLF